MQKENTKLNIDYLTQFDSNTAKDILESFNQEELLKFTENDLYTYLLDENFWKEDYSSKEEIPKEVLIEEILSSYWEY